MLFILLCLFTFALLFQLRRSRACGSLHGAERGLRFLRVARSGGPAVFQACLRRQVSVTLTGVESCGVGLI